MLDLRPFYSLPPTVVILRGWVRLALLPLWMTVALVFKDTILFLVTGTHASELRFALESTQLIVCVLPVPRT